MAECCPAPSRFPASPERRSRRYPIPEATPILRKIPLDPPASVPPQATACQMGLVRREVPARRRIRPAGIHHHRIRRSPEQDNPLLAHKILRRVWAVGHPGPAEFLAACRGKLRVRPSRLERRASLTLPLSPL